MPDFSGNRVAAFRTELRLLAVNASIPEVATLQPKEIAMNRKALVCATAVAAALWCSAAQAVPQAFVQSDGDDNNTGARCPSYKPCRTFAAALTVVDDGGDVIALDTEDYGPVKIAQSVSIIGNGSAGIVVSAFNAVGVDIVKAGVNVVLRGLTITGSALGGAGVSMKDSGSLQVEKCVLANFFGNGISVYGPASVRIVESVMRGNSIGAVIQGGATANVVKSQFLGNRGMGLMVLADTPATTSAVVNDSVASGNGSSGFAAESVDKSGLGRMVVTGSTAAHNRQAGFLSAAAYGNAIITVGRSTSAHNGIGFAQLPGVGGTSTLETLGDNFVRNNNSVSQGLIVAVPPM